MCAHPRSLCKIPLDASARETCPCRSLAPSESPQLRRRRENATHVPRPKRPSVQGEGVFAGPDIAQLLVFAATVVPPLVEVPDAEVPLVLPLAVPLLVEVPLVVPPLVEVTLSVVDVQKVPTQVAPSVAHLQLVFVVHQPSMPGVPFPASMHVCMLGFAVQLQI